MSLQSTANGAFAVLNIKESPVLVIRATLSAELVVIRRRSEAWLAQIGPVGQIRELVSCLSFAALVAGCTTVPNPFVLDPMQSLLDQMVPDDPERHARPSRNFLDRQAFFVEGRNRVQ